MDLKYFTLLYVENDKEIRGLLGIALKKWTKELYIAENGKEGLELFHSKSPDIIITDIRMPIMDGLEMIKEIRKLSPKTPIIVTSAYGESRYLFETIEYEVTAYQLKPIAPKKLKEKLESIAKILRLEQENQRYRELLEKIVELNENMIVLFDKTGIPVFANQSFLEFFDSDSIESFNEENQRFPTLFENKEGFFSYEEEGNWIEVFYPLKNEKHLVLMQSLKDFSFHAFVINIRYVHSDESYVCSFSEVTGIATEKYELQTKVYRDELTGIYNRAKFNEEFKEDLAFSKLHQEPLSVILFDIDLFKNINDTYGHSIGDDILKDLSQLSQQNIRSTDLLARWGGEEFILLLPNVDSSNAKKIAEKLRIAVKEHLFPHDIKICCSYGVTQAKDDDTELSVFDRVDEALYQAKNLGRDRVEVI